MLFIYIILSQSASFVYVFRNKNVHLAMITSKGRIRFNWKTAK